MRRLLTALALVITAAVVPVPPPASAQSAPRAVIERRVIGMSVQGRPIIAWHLGETAEQAGRRVPRVLLISTMHGNEPATRQILASLRDGRRIRDIDLWVVPVYNPDGLARGTRKNAHGVDLNRNFPQGWRDLDGNYESGSGPASEPETRAMMAFVADIGPQTILSFHQPLHGVDTDVKDKRLASEVARRLRLPRTTLSCGGVCHGTMTGWFNSRFPGAMLTVEYGAHPARRTMTLDAPRQVLAVFGARRGGD